MYFQYFSSLVFTANSMQLYINKFPKFKFFFKAKVNTDKLSANCIPLKATQPFVITNPHKEEKGHSCNHMQKLEAEVQNCVSVGLPIFWVTLGKSPAVVCISIANCKLEIISST